MAINFPNNPSFNDTHTVGTSTWRWNGYAWIRVPDPGDKGEKGESGGKGEKGTTGQKGNIGDKGNKGEPSTVEGPKGDKGQKGEQNDKGQNGEPSTVAGPKGDKGDKGDTGVGTKGEKGENGADGGSGADGSKGDKGDEGQKGATGSGATSLDSDAQENTVGGTDAGLNLDSDTYRNTLFGYQAGEQVNSGDDNTLLGWKAGDKITSGTKNCAVGSESLEFLQTGSSNVAMGWEAGRSCSGSDNTMIGDMAGRSMSGNYNIAIGRHAYSNGGGTHSIGIGGESVWTGGDYVIGIGPWASAGHFGDKTGSIGIGYYAGRHDNGPYNLYMGWEAGFGYYVSTFSSSYGNTNIGLGYKSLRAIYSGSGNIAIGASAGIGVSTGNNNIIIGNNVDVATSSTSNQIIIGNSSSSKFSIPGINVVLKDNGGTPTAGHVLTVDSSGEASFEAASGGVPIGTIVMYGGSTAPSGWQLCDGATPQTTALQTLLGGAGQTVPDLRDKFVVGSGSSYNLKATGGSADAVVVEHKHTTNIDGGHVIPGNGGSSFPYGGAGTYSSTVFSMSNEGVSGTNKNLPPYYALTYIIKY